MNPSERNRADSSENAMTKAPGGPGFRRVAVLAAATALIVAAAMGLAPVPADAQAGGGAGGNAGGGAGGGAGGQAATAPSQRPAASVNGEIITVGRLNDLMIRAWGYEAINQLIGDALVMQAAAAAGIDVTDADAAAEQDVTLRTMFPQVEGASPEALLAEVLRSRNVPRHIWDVTMRRNAALRKLALKRIMITDEMLTDAFNSRYGLKVQIRHIQCSSMADAQKLYSMLADGADFVELAKQYSINAESAADGGLVAPFSRDDREIPAVIRQAAFSLADGKISDILQEDRYYHIIRRERTLPPDTTVKFADVREQLKAELTENLVRMLQPRIIAELRGEADIVLLDPVLKQDAARREATQGY